MWDKYSVWIEPLASMFEVLRLELLFQAKLLPAGEHVHSELHVALNVVEQVVNKHLVSLERKDKDGPRIGEQGWLDLMRELDRNEVALDKELPPIAKRLLTNLRRKGFRIDSWEKAYLSSQPVTLEDANERSLRYQIRIFIHNTAKRVRRLSARSA